MVVPELKRLNKMKLTSKVVLVWAVFFGLCGCSMVQRFEDVGSVSEYRSYVGSTYRMQVPMHLSGVNAPPGYEKTVNYYKLNPTSPSWGGPELITRETLPVGTVVTVKSVRRCTNCPFDKVVEAEISIVGYTTAVSRPIFIPLTYLTPGFATIK